MRRRKPIDHPHNEVASLMFYWRCERENWLKEHPESQTIPLPLRTTITLFCQSGLRKSEFVKNLAYELRYVLLDHDLLNYVAGHLGVKCQWVENLQKPQREELSQWMKYTLPHLLKQKDERVVANCEVIKGGILHGGLVVLNHGANLLLDNTPGLRMRLIASKEMRIVNLVQYEYKTKEQAEEEIEKYDSAQEDYMARYFGKDVHDATLYDLNVDGTYLNFDDLIRIIVQAMRERGWEAATRSKRFKRILT